MDMELVSGSLRCPVRQFILLRFSCSTTAEGGREDIGVAEKLLVPTEGDLPAWVSKEMPPQKAGAEQI